MFTLKFSKMKRIHHRITVEARSVASLLIIASLLSGCKDQSMYESDDPYDASNPVSFVTHLDMVTRGAPINNVAHLTSMGVFCAATGDFDWKNTDALNKMFDKKLNHQSGIWKYEQGEEIFWDAASLTSRYSFFAYTPYADLILRNSSSTSLLPMASLSSGEHECLTSINALAFSMVWLTDTLGLDVMAK